MEKVKNFFKNRKLWLVVLLFLVFLVVIVEVFYPRFFYHPFSPKHHKVQPNIPTASLKTVSPIGITDNVVDEPVQTTGCNTPLSLKPGIATFVTIKSDNKQRRFIVYLPPNYTNLVEHPLVLGFHGYDDSPNDMERFSGFDALAKSGNFIMVYPEGSKALGGALGWNTGLHPTIRGNDVLFVSNLLNSLQANLCINPQQIYASGFSNGGGFVGELACKMSNRISAFAPVSGSYLTFFSSCDTTRPVPIMEFHGNADSIVPYPGLPSLREVAAFNWVSGWAKRDGCSANPAVVQESKLVTRYTWINCGDNAEVVHYKIIGGKHVWPRNLFMEQVDSKEEYLNVSQTIWNFFKQHPLSV